jgi:hypothetical protein
LQIKALSKYSLFWSSKQTNNTQTLKNKRYRCDFTTESNEQRLRTFKYCMECLANQVCESMRATDFRKNSSLGIACISVYYNSPNDSLGNSRHHFGTVWRLMVPPLTTLRIHDITVSSRAQQQTMNAFYYNSITLCIRWNVIPTLRPLLCNFTQSEQERKFYYHPRISVRKRCVALQQLFNYIITYSKYPCTRNSHLTLHCQKYIGENLKVVRCFPMLIQSFVYTASIFHNMDRFCTIVLENKFPLVRMGWILQISRVDYWQTHTTGPETRYIPDKSRSDQIRKTWHIFNFY